MTRRGRVVIVGVVLGVLLAGLLLGLGEGWIGEGASPAAAAPARVAVVQPGETLWDLALRAAPQADPRRTVAEIERINTLEGPTIQPGQRLVLPRQ